MPAAPGGATRPSAGWLAGLANWLTGRTRGPAVTHLLVGLGNPGPQYARHRHNIGFMVIDALADRLGLTAYRRRFQAMTAEATIGGRRLLLMKPMTFMNESGRAVGEAMRFFKLTPDRLIVVHDELDLPPGKCRVKRGGGAGGHNGLRSLDRHIGPDYWRVRLGIGHPGRKEAVQGYVLRDFPRADEAWLDPLIDAVVDAVPALIEDRPDRFMNAVSLKTREPETR